MLVRSLVGALRSHMLCGVAKKKKKIWLSSYREVAEFIPNNKTVSVEESFPEILLIHKKFSRYKTRKKGVIQNVACGLEKGVREETSWPYL